MIKRDAKRYYTLPALEKGFDILELFASTSEGLTVSEAARRLSRTDLDPTRQQRCRGGRATLVLLH